MNLLTCFISDYEFKILFSPPKFTKFPYTLMTQIFLKNGQGWENPSTKKMFFRPQFFLVGISIMMEPGHYIF